MVGDCLFSSEAKLWSREQLCKVCVLRDEVPVERSGSTKLIGYPLERTSGDLAHLIFHLIATEWLTMDSLDNTP